MRNDNCQFDQKDLKRWGDLKSNLFTTFYIKLNKKTESFLTRFSILILCTNYLILVIILLLQK